MTLEQLKKFNPDIHELQFYKRVHHTSFQIFPASILKVGQQKVFIRYQLPEGGTKDAWVSPEALDIKR